MRDPATGRQFLICRGSSDRSPVPYLSRIQRRLGAPLETVEFAHEARLAIETMQRRWPNSGRGVDLIDLNREWPGDENGASAASRHAGLVFNRLLKPNSDLAIDFHTGTTGLEMPPSSSGSKHPGRQGHERSVPNRTDVGRSRLSGGAA